MSDLPQTKRQFKFCYIWGKSFFFFLGGILPMVKIWTRGEKFVLVQFLLISQGWPPLFPPLASNNLPFPSTLLQKLRKSLLANYKSWNYVRECFGKGNIGFGPNHHLICIPIIYLFWFEFSICHKKWLRSLCIALQSK